LGNAAAAGEKKAEETLGGSERRKQERFECDGFAEVVVDDAAFLFRGTIRDFSMTGCFIKSRARLNLAPGSEVDLRFSVDGDHFIARARLMIIRPGGGAGFEFLLGNAELQSRLLTLVTRFGGAAPSVSQRSNDNPEASAGSDPSRSLWK
jgi:hypothetical protein